MFPDHPQGSLEFAAEHGRKHARRLLARLQILHSLPADFGMRANATWLKPACLRWEMIDEASSEKCMDRPHSEEAANASALAMRQLHARR
jgi:hypothetical protein